MHIKSNQATYFDLQRNDKLFDARVLCVINVRVQSFFRTAQQRKFDPDPIDFSRTFEEIINYRTFKSYLPSCIHNIKNQEKT